MTSYAIKNTDTGKWYIGTQLYNANKNGHFRQFCSDKMAKLFETYQQAEIEMKVRRMPSHYKVVKVAVEEKEVE